MSEKKLLVGSVILFIAAVMFLFWQNDRQLSPQNSKNLWNISFAEPERPESLEFTIDNQSDDTNFDYSIIENKKTLETNSIVVQKTRTTTVKPLTLAEPGKQVTISVTHNQEKKDIYRK